MIQKDLLFECFEKILDSLCPNDEADILVARVVEEYLMRLIRQAHIPIRYLESLREDLSADVQDMLKVKTYGYVSVGEYLAQRQNTRATKKARPN